MVRSFVQFTEQDAGGKISAEEFATAEMKPPFRYERVQGRLAVMSPAGPEHRSVSKPFRRELGAYWARHPNGIDDVDIKGWVAVSCETDRIPDICVYLTDTQNQETVPHRAPDLIFEFVSADRSDQERDYIDKRKEYHAIGVREYVIVDRFKQSALVLTWRAGDFSEQVLAASETYETLLLPGMRVSLSEAFQS